MPALPGEGIVAKMTVAGNRGGEESGGGDAAGPGQVDLGGQGVVGREEMGGDDGLEGVGPGVEAEPQPGSRGGGEVEWVGGVHRRAQQPGGGRGFERCIELGDFGVVGVQQVQVEGLGSVGPPPRHPGEMDGGQAVRAQDLHILQGQGLGLHCRRGRQHVDAGGRSDGDRRGQFDLQVIVAGRGGRGQGEEEGGALGGQEGQGVGEGGLLHDLALLLPDGAVREPGWQGGRRGRRGRDRG